MSLQRVTSFRLGDQVAHHKLGACIVHEIRGDELIIMNLLGEPQFEGVWTHEVMFILESKVFPKFQVEDRVRNKYNEKICEIISSIRYTPTEGFLYEMGYWDVFELCEDDLIIVSKEVSNKD